MLKYPSKSFNTNFIFKGLKEVKLIVIYAFLYGLNYILLLS